MRNSDLVSDGFLTLTAASLVLLGSSLTVALAVRAAQLRQKKQLVPLLIATVVLGTMFLAIKATEYYIDYREHLIPTPAQWHPELRSKENPNGWPPESIKGFSSAAT